MYACLLSSVSDLVSVLQLIAASYPCNIFFVREVSVTKDVAELPVPSNLDLRYGRHLYPPYFQSAEIGLLSRYMMPVVSEAQSRLPRCGARRHPHPVADGYINRSAQSGVRW